MSAGRVRRGRGAGSRERGAGSGKRGARSGEPGAAAPSPRSATSTFPPQPQPIRSDPARTCLAPINPPTRQSAILPRPLIGLSLIWRSQQCGRLEQVVGQFEPLRGRRHGLGVVASPHFVPTQQVLSAAYGPPGGFFWKWASSAAINGSISSCVTAQTILKSTAP